MGMGWPVGSDKWKAPWVDWETRKLTLFAIRQLFSLNGALQRAPAGCSEIIASL